MIKKELKKRINTSAFLFIITLCCIFINKFIFIISVFFISYLSYKESLLILHKISKKKFFNICVSIFYFFIIFAASSVGLYLIYGSVFFMYILLICMSSDIGGFFIGKTVGGKKLIKKISPNKTIAGSVGSFFFSIIPLLIFYFFNQNEYSLNITNLIFCLEVSLICQLGDLIISFFKRKAKIKDTGKILPGHGGILDRIDGIILVIPFIFISLIGISNYFDIWSNLIPYLMLSS